MVFYILISHSVLAIQTRTMEETKAIENVGCWTDSLGVDNQDNAKVVSYDLKELADMIMREQPRMQKHRAINRLGTRSC